MKFGLRQRVGLIVGPLLFLAVGFGLEGGGPAAEARWTAAIVALMATWWITEPLPLWLTALLPAIAFPLCGAAPLVPVLLQYADPVNFLFLGGMMIAAAMQHWGLHRRIALAIIARIGTSPRRLVLGFMLATGFVSLWISNTAATLVMFPIAMAVLIKFRESAAPGDILPQRFGLALMLGLAYAASIGGIGTKIGTAPNLVFAREAVPFLGREIDFATWLRVGLPIVLIALPLVWAYLVHIAAPLPHGGLGHAERLLRTERAGLGAMSRGEWVVLAGFLGAAWLWAFRKDIDLGDLIIPGWSRLIPVGASQWIEQQAGILPEAFARLLRRDLGDAAVAMGVGIALLCTPTSLGPTRFALPLGCLRALPWHLLVLLGGGIAMAFGIQESGLSAWTAGLLRGMPPLDPLAAILVVSFISVLLTEVASNLATASMLLPLIAASADSFGLHPAPLMLAATMAASFGFMLPAGTPPNAIVYSSGYISVPEMARSGILVDLTGALLVGLICYLLGPWALGVELRS